MSLSDVVSAAAAVFRRRPSDLLPFYLLGAAIPAIVRIVPFFAGALVYAYLAATGRLETALAELDGLEQPMPDPQDAEALEAWLSDLWPVLDAVLTPTTILLVLLTILLVVLGFLVLAALVSAGQLAACYGRLRDDRGLVTGIAGLRRHWLRFLGLFLLEVVCWIGAVLVVAIPTVLVALLASALEPLLGVLVGLLGALLAVVAVLAVRAVFAFAPVAVVVDDVSVVDSLSNAIRFVRRRPVEAGFYYVVSVGSLLAVSAVSGLLLFVDVVMAASLLTTLVLLPALDLLKTALYGRHRGLPRPPGPPERSVRSQLRAGLGRGWRAVTAFVRDTPGIHAFVVVVGVASFVGGWLLVGPYADVLPQASIETRLEGLVPPAAALEFFGNNWLVAITTAFAGLAFVVPALFAVVFNGVAIGVTARLEAEPLELLAFVLPHGVLEIPAILVSGALGVWLGVVGWRAVRGRADRNAVADALERAFWVVVGVGLLLAVAGLIEGFVSPYYWRPFI
ncbi:stage II sporulation protein M [Halopiger goleimassiliensis]|uniref:stage II sporulation protein M n=1 Tax=Halopiger goleimassiliensis TaxID=1293048 RepID=UPI000677D866|nr:stage II sporulation protein M [Halopiger goleimassiliensis]